MEGTPHLVAIVLIGPHRFTVLCPTLDYICLHCFILFPLAPFFSMSSKPKIHIQNVRRVLNETSKLNDGRDFSHAVERVSMIIRFLMVFQSYFALSQILDGRALKSWIKISDWTVLYVTSRLFEKHVYSVHNSWPSFFLHLQCPEQITRTRVFVFQCNVSRRFS